jgi:hypothetical protein
MRLFCSSLLLTLTSLSFAGEDTPLDKNMTELAALTGALSIASRKPSLHRQSSPPINIVRSPKPRNRTIGGGQSSSPSTNSENSLSSSPASTNRQANITPGTSPESSNSGRPPYYWGPSDYGFDIPSASHGSHYFPYNPYKQYH